MADSIQLKYEETGLDDNIKSLKAYADAAKEAHGESSKLNDELKAMSKASRSASKGIDKLTDSLSKSLVPLTSAVGLTRLLKENLNSIGNTWEGIPGMGGRGRGGGGSGGGRRPGVDSGYGPRDRTYNAGPRGRYPQGKNHEFADLDRAAARDKELMAGFEEAFHAELLSSSMIFKDRQKVKDKQQYGIGHAIKDLIGTTRVGFGANGIEVSPLVNRGIAVAEKLVTGGGVALGGAMAAAAAAIYAVSKGIERNIIISRLATGSSLNQADKAYHAAQTLGMDPNQIGRADMGIHEPGTPGWYYAIRAGINPYRNPYSGQGYDDPSNTLKEMRTILMNKSMNDGQLKAAAKEWGMENLLVMRNLPDDDKEKILDQAGRKYSPQGQKDLARTQKDINQLKAATEDFWVGISNWLTKPPGYDMKKYMEDEGYKDLGLNPDGTRQTSKQAQMNQADAERAKEAQSRDRHTEAMNKHSDALTKALANFPGNFGSGGPRTDAAIPKGWGTAGWWNQQYDGYSYNKVRRAGF